MIDSVYDGGRLFLENHDYILNNVYMFDWESDLFAISKTGYATEIEVKVARSDFKADFQKKKHELLKMQMKGEKYFQLHKADNGKRGCYVEFAEIVERIPNRFYFACPEGLIYADEVPSYAGLIYTGDRYADFEIKKKAPLIHKQKNDFQKRLLSKYYNTSLQTRGRIANMLYRMKQNPFCEADIEKDLKSILRLLK